MQLLPQVSMKLSEHSKVSMNRLSQLLLQLLLLQRQLGLLKEEMQQLQRMRQSLNRSAPRKLRRWPL